MKLTKDAVGTPKYVLVGANGRIGPEVAPLHSGRTCSVIFGFSDKGPYDRFCSQSVLPLTPYPLVRGYLRDQLESAGPGLTLVVIDAAGPREPLLQATTMIAVLDAQERKANYLSAKYRLVLEEQASAYKVEEVEADD